MSYGSDNERKKVENKTPSKLSTCKNLKNQLMNNATGLNPLLNPQQQIQEMRQQQTGESISSNRKKLFFKPVTKNPDDPKKKPTDDPGRETY